jgi:hypothetical protein
VNGDLCSNRKTYASQDGARKVIDQVCSRRGKHLQAYHCPNCGFWHIGPQPGSVATGKYRQATGWRPRR